MKITIQIALGLLMFTGILFTQQLEWAARYTGSAGYEQHINDAVTDKYGNTYICGFIQLPNQINSRDAIILKINSAGVVEWSKIYAGIDSLEEVFTAIDIDSTGNTYVTGYIEKILTTLDMLTQKYDKYGNLKWSKEYDGSNSLDKGNDLIINSNIIFIVGESYVTFSNSDYITISYDSMGNNLWTRFFNGTGNLTDIGRKITKDRFNNLIISGLSKRDPFNNDVVTIKYDFSGNIIWTKIYAGVNNEGADGSDNLQTDLNNNIYFNTGIPNGTRRIFKYSSTGDSIWIKSLPVGVLPVAMDVKKDYFYLSTNKAGDIHTYKFNLSGDSLWKKVYPVLTYTSYDEVTDASVDEYNNLYITGFCDSNWIANDYLTVKYDSLGNLKWSKRYSLALFADDKAYKIGLDTADNVYVTGISGGQITTIKYSQPPVGVINIGNEIPLVYRLYQNYPNPFNPHTKIKYTNKDNSSKVQLIVTDILGRQVFKLVDEIQNTGLYEVSFNATGESSGIYFYRLIVDGKIIDTKKMIILK